jgi:hypothetical protein
VSALGLTAYAGVAADVAAQVREARLDHAAFERPVRACELERCRATCCHDGVHLSTEEAAGIIELLERQAQTLRDFGLELPAEPVLAVDGGWKTAVRAARPGELAEDYPAHFPRTRCVLLDPQGRCGLQRFAVAEGRHPWYYKPLTCWIHPLALRPMTRDRDRPELTVHGPEDDPQRTAGYAGFASCTHCGRPDAAGASARVVLAAELAALGQLAGRDLLGELGGHSAPADWRA